MDILLEGGPFAGVTLEALPAGAYALVEMVEVGPGGKLMLRAYAPSASFFGTAVAQRRPLLDRQVPGWAPKKHY